MITRTQNDYKTESDIEAMLIYLSDKNALLTKTFQKFLENLNHGVITFDSVTALLDGNKQDSSEPDLILVDLEGSTEESTSEIRRIHSKFPDSHIIVMSSVLPSEVAISHGVFAYLHKPARFAELELLLKRLSEARGKVGSL